VIAPLRAKVIKRENVLSLEGGASSAKSSNIAKFKEQLKGIIAGVSH